MIEAPKSSGDYYGVQCHLLAKSIFLLCFVFNHVIYTCVFRREKFLLQSMIKKKPFSSQLMISVKDIMLGLNRKFAYDKMKVIVLLVFSYQIGHRQCHCQC